MLLNSLTRRVLNPSAREPGKFQGSLFLRSEDGQSWQQVFVELRGGNMVVHRGDQVSPPPGMRFTVAARTTFRLGFRIGWSAFWHR